MLGGGEERQKQESWRDSENKGPGEAEPHRAGRERWRETAVKPREKKLTPTPSPSIPHKEPDRDKEWRCKWKCIQSQGTERASRCPSLSRLQTRGKEG
jgi:hypothetical protein